MEIVLIILVLVLIALVAFLGLQLRAISAPKGVDETAALVQRQVETFRGEVSDQLSKNQTAMNEQLLTVTTQVSEQLRSVTTLVNDQLSKNQTAMSEQLGSVTKDVNTRLTGVTDTLQKSTGQVNERMDKAAQVVSEVSKRLGELSKATEQVHNVGQDIASLQTILSAPKVRGGLGEFFLVDLLKQMLPSENYSTQYAFRDGKVVDSIIRFNDGIVPVDSKFPLENFKKMVEAEGSDERRTWKKKFIGDVKKRIDEIADSYIRPDEGTFDFALMYIPAENVFYETIIKDDVLENSRALQDYAYERRVIPVSPNSFYAYLQTILLGLRGMEVSKQAKEIINQLKSLNNEFALFEDDFRMVGKHLGNSNKKYDEAGKHLERFGGKLSAIEAAPVDDTGQEPILKDTKALL